MQKYCFLTGTFCLGGVMPIEFQNGDEKSVNLPSQRGEKRINRVTLSTLRGLCANLFHDLLWKRLPQKQLKTPYFGVKWYK